MFHSKPGSGYLSGAAGSGGGAIRIQAASIVSVDGTITANGGNGSGSDGGGGAGGGIYITCRTFQGTNGTLNAKGGTTGNRYVGGGGGGRIAVWRIYHTFSGTNISAIGGAESGSSGYDGTNGTVVWGQIPAPGTIVKMW
ncbi:MAG: hypothetical protein HYV35_12245 [Lentisphaerae bacterium]|nr:hypothetical protein [Lentisphaerota bacterium]